MKFEQLPDGAIVFYYGEEGMETDRQKIIAALEEQLEGTVMSKYASQAECKAARAALEDAIRVVTACA
jgi:hypothetical protein